MYVFVLCACVCACVCECVRLCECACGNVCARVSNTPLLPLDIHTCRHAHAHTYTHKHTQCFSPSNPTQRPLCLSPPLSWLPPSRSTRAYHPPVCPTLLRIRSTPAMRTAPAHIATTTTRTATATNVCV